MMDFGPSSRRGLTLVELLIGVTIGAILTTAAVAFVRHETRLMGATNERLSLLQSGRASLDLIASDLQLAGLGTGLDSFNNFGGLLTGPFAIGGIAFNQAGLNTITLEQGYPSTGSYVVNSDDLGIRLAEGEQSSIVDFVNLGGNGSLRICDNPNLNLDAGDLVVLRDELYLASRSVRLDSPSASPACECVAGCTTFTWNEPAGTGPADGNGYHYVSYPGAENVDYTLGALFSAFKTIVYFVADQGSGSNRGQLRRVVFDPDNPTNTADCALRTTCGVALAENVEALFVEVWGFTPGTSTWTQAPPGGIPGADRLRVDIEMVMRSRVPANAVQPPAVSGLNGTTFPPAGRDRIEREVYRTSVDVRNSGRI
ncbi:MAG: PilW family protein [Myxococcota bacterium]